MVKLLLLFTYLSLELACGSAATNNGAANRANITASNTNGNTIQYSRSENAYTTASNSPLGNLTPSGKSATDLVGKTITEAKLWEHKDVGPRIKKIMGADYATMRKFWNVETPIKKFGDFLMMTGCEQHNCGDNQYVIFMDMARGGISVVHISNGTTKDWSDGDIDLPPPFAEALAAMTSR
jgi:hypothetical protein